MLKRWGREHEVLLAFEAVWRPKEGPVAQFDTLQAPDYNATRGEMAEWLKAAVC